METFNLGSLGSGTSTVDAHWEQHIGGPFAMWFLSHMGIVVNSQ